MWGLKRAVLSGMSFLVTASLTAAAYAASSSEWADPAVEAATSIQDGLVKFAAPVLGIAVILVGVVFLIKQMFNLTVIATVMGAGLIIAVGPAAVTTLFSLGN